MENTREMIDNQTLIFPIDCINGVPSAEEFFSSLKWIHKWILVMPVGFWFMTLSVFIVNLRRVIKHETKETKSNVLILLVLYPIVACTSLISIFMPRTYFFCDTVAHICFVLTSYQFYRYCINCIEGESNFIAVSTKESFTLQAPPLCCCCMCFGKSNITKEKFLWIRILVLQMAIVHIIIFSILNLIYIESNELLDDVMIYFIPFIVSTILLAVWGFQITVRMLVPYYSNLNLLKKFIAFQLVLVFCKLQPTLLNLMLKPLITSCEDSITAIVKIRTITQILIQLEMIILSLWSHFLYTGNYNSM